MHSILNKHKISDLGVREFANALECFSKVLVSLQLDFAGTLISDEGLEKLLRFQMPEIVEFTLLVGRTNISNKSLDTFCLTLLPSMSLLTSLRVDLTKTHLRKRSILNLFKKLKGLKSLTLSLEGTDTTDICIEALVNNSLIKENQIKCLDLYLGNTKITDEYLNPIFACIKTAEYLSIDLQYTNVTDQGLKQILKIVPGDQKYLANFEINLEGTNVSNELKLEIDKHKALYQTENAHSYGYNNF